MKLHSAAKSEDGPVELKLRGTGALLLSNFIVSYSHDLKEKFEIRLEKSMELITPILSMDLWFKEFALYTIAKKLILNISRHDV